MQVFQTVTQLKANSGVTDNAGHVLGYHTPGDGGGGKFYWDPTSLDPDNNGTVFALSAGGTGRWKRIYNEAINVKWFGTNGINDSASFAAALDFCKQNGIDLFIPSGTYDTSIELDWCVTDYYYQLLSNKPSYNPADPAQGTAIGRSFNIRGEANTKITGDLVLRRCRDMEVSDIICGGNFIAVACELLKFSKISAQKTASLAYYSDDFTDIAMKLKYFLVLPPLEPTQSISDGGCYWLSFTDCFLKKALSLEGKMWCNIT